MAKTVPAILKTRRAPREVQGRPRVISGIYGYGVTDGFRDRRTPTPVELVAAYRQAAYACANLNASAFASTPLRLYGKTGYGKKAIDSYYRPKPLTHSQTKNLESIAGLRKQLSSAEKVEEITNHPILDLLDTVNPWMDRFQLLELTQLYQEIVGPAFWTFGYQSLGRHRVPVEIWPLPAWMVYPVPDLINPGGVIQEYIFTAGGGQTILPVEEVLYFKTSNLLSPYDQSYSPLRATYENSQIYDKRNQYEDAVLDNRARPDALLIPTEEGAVVSPEEVQRINTQFYQQFGMSGAGRVAILPGGYSYHPMNYVPKDMEIPAKQKVTLHEIARSFGVPIPLVDVDSANRSILDAALLQHARFTVRPRCRRAEEMLNSNFCNRFDENLFLAFDDPTPADVVLDRETDKAYFGIGCRTPNEIRASQGLPPLPKGGDETYIPQGMVPMSMANDRAQRELIASLPAAKPDEVPDDTREPEEFPDEPSGEDETEYDEGEADGSEGEPSARTEGKSLTTEAEIRERATEVLTAIKSLMDRENSGNNPGVPANTLGSKGAKPKPPKPDKKPTGSGAGSGANCGTGGGGFKPGNTCQRPVVGHGPAGAGHKPADKPKTSRSRHAVPDHGPGINRKLAISAAAAKTEGKVAKAIGGRNVGNFDPLRDKRNPAYDVHIPKAKSPTGRDEFVEVKYKSEGAKNTLSVHADALLRKADHHAEEPKAGYHTVLIDVRDRSFGGSEAKHYQGHGIYYRRGTGAYSTNNMQPVKSMAELKKLIATPDNKLPVLARGTMPKRTPALEAQAAKVEASRARRDSGGKKEERRRAYNERKRAGLVGTTSKAAVTA